MLQQYFSHRLRIMDKTSIQSRIFAVKLLLEEKFIFYPNIVESLKKFRVCLIGKKSGVVTDCNDLRATCTKKKEILPRVAN